jgi:hypothetical protein
MAFWARNKKIVLLIFFLLILISIISSQDSNAAAIDNKYVSISWNNLAIVFTLFSTLIALLEMRNNIKQDKIIKNKTQSHVDVLISGCKKIEFYNDLIQKKTSSFEKFGSNIAEKITIESYIAESVGIIIIDFSKELSTYFLNQTKKSSLPSSDENIRSFIQYLILVKSDKFSYLSKRIKDQFETKSLFNNLIIAYYTYEIKDDINKIILKANELLQDSAKSIRMQNESVINSISDKNKEKLYSYITRVINKDLSVKSLVNSIRNFQGFSNRYIVFLSRDQSCNECAIKEYFDENDGIKLVNSPHGDVYYFESKKEHESAENFVNNELMPIVKNDCSQMVFAVEIAPMCYYKGINKPENTFGKNYVEISNKIDEKLYNYLLVELIEISGRPIYELVEKASLDFFSDQVYVNETKILRNNSDLILTQIIKQNDETCSTTKMLSKLDEAELTKILVDNNLFEKDRAQIITKSIIASAELWRKVLYGE